jgi:LmbE family N-acetylglucosaminyl deacetylase
MAMIAGSATGHILEASSILDAGAGRATALAYRLRSLSIAGAVLQIGAHPDDEESGMLALMARGRGARAVYWSATRGAGGQNKRGPERGDALGVLRTWESLDARSIDGGEVLYGPFIDFGFAKDGAQVLRRWGRENLVREVVRAIRLVQPLVLISRWSGSPADGHGHHQAVGMVVNDAVAAAADPERFPELRLPAWRTAKVYRSLSGDWQPGEDADFGARVSAYERSGYLRLDAGELDPVSGLSFQELGQLALNRHRSQGMGFVPAPGAFFYYYRLECTHGIPPTARERTLYDGADPGLTGLTQHPGGGPPDLRERLDGIGRLLIEACEAYRPHAPFNALPGLCDGLAGIRGLRRTLDTGDEALALALRRREDALQDAVALCLGLRLECTAERARVTPGGRVVVRARLVHGNAQAVEIEHLGLQVPDGWSMEALGNGEFAVTVPPDAVPRAPYWLREAHGPDAYVWAADADEVGQPFDDPLVIAVAHVRLGEQRLSLRAPAADRSGFPGGSRSLPVTVVPPIALLPRESRVVLARSEEDRVLECAVLARCIDPASGPEAVSLSAPAGWSVLPERFELMYERAGDSRTLHFHVNVPGGVPEGSYELRLSGVELNPVRLGAPGAPGPVDEDSCIAEVNLIRRVTISVDLVDVSFVRTLRYGYIRGIEEDIVASLSRFDLDLVELDDDQLRYGDLQSYDAIVVGPNAYNLRPAVRREARQLLNYVAEGGTLLVQYQGYGYDDPGLAPYLFRLNQPHDRVTDPTAPVELLDPGSPILSSPNNVGIIDFDGWIHDRGLYFFGEWDRRYTPVLAMHDPGEPELRGGLLTAAYGRGTYVYCGLSLHRQVPAGVPGAIRLLANILGLAEARVRERMEQLRELELFSYMNEDELYAAARIISERDVDAGTYLSREGDPARELFVLLEGKVEVVKQLPAGERVLHVAYRGESLGELALLADIPRSASLRAATEVTILALRSETFNEWLQSQPDLGQRLLRLLARKIISRDPAD